jgi:DNA-binding phage protein
MQKSTSQFDDVLSALTRAARARQLTDTAWAASAGVRKETLSRLRSRKTADFDTLRALAEAAGTRFNVVEVSGIKLTPDGHFPAGMNRDYEEQLVDLCASRDLSPAVWLRFGPRFFMAGLAVMAANVRGYDREGLLELAEELHPGSTESVVFSKWLERSPVRPTRFLPFLDQAIARASQ